MAKRKTKADSARSAGESDPVHPPEARTNTGRPAFVSMLTPTEQATVRQAVAKKNAGQQLSREEKRVLTKFEKEQGERNRNIAYMAMPKKEWIQASGRQHKSVDDLGNNYGFPVLGPTINLYEVISFLHRFMAENGHKLMKDVDADLESGMEKTPALEKLREESYRLKRLERKEREQQLIQRHKIRECFAILAGLMRGFGEKLQNKYGAEAAEMSNELLSNFAANIETFLGFKGDK